MIKTTHDEFQSTTSIISQGNLTSNYEITHHTGCHRRNGPNFGGVFLMLNYIDITQNTYIQS